MRLVGVVHDHRQVVGVGAVAAAQHDVVHDGLDVAVHQVGERDHLRARVQAQRRRPAGGALASRPAGPPSGHGRCPGRRPRAAGRGGPAPPRGSRPACTSTGTRGPGPPAAPARRRTARGARTGARAPRPSRCPRARRSASCASLVLAASSAAGPGPRSAAGTARPATAPAARPPARCAGCPRAAGRRGWGRSGRCGPWRSSTARQGACAPRKPGARALLRRPAVARPAAGAGVEPAAVDDHVDVAGVRVDRDPLARAGGAVAGEPARGARGLQQAAAAQRVGDRARAVVARVVERAVAAAVLVRRGGDPVGRRDHARHARVATAAAGAAGALALEHRAGAEPRLRAGQRAGDAVGLEPVRALPALERGLGLGAEHAVGAGADRALERLDAAAAGRHRTGGAARRRRGPCRRA